MAELVANRYAVALFELAKESGKIDEYLAEVNFVLQVYRDEHELVKAIEHPMITSSEKIVMLESIFKGKVSDDLLGLFFLVLRKNRETEIRDILDAFVKKVHEYTRVTEAIVYSAIPISPAQLQNIANNLSKNLNKQVTVISEVDKSLIGGLCIRVDGYIIDGTIKSELTDMKNKLLNIKLA